MAGVVAEGFFFEEKRYESDMTRIHSLNRKSFGIHLDVDHLHKFFKRIYDLSENRALIQSCLKHLFSGKLLI